MAPKTETKTETKTFIGRAGAFLREVLDHDRKDDITDRDTLLNMIHAHGSRAVVFELVVDGGDKVDLVLFHDGSAFCVSADKDYTPWPIAWISNNALDETEFTPRFENAIEVIDFPAEHGEVYSRDDALDIPGAENWFEAIAAEMPDPPEALRDAIVANEQDVYWEDREGQEFAQSLILDFVGHYMPVACKVMIRTHNDAGRPPVQKRHEESLCKQLNEIGVGFGTRFEREAMYAGDAYAEIHEAAGVDWLGISPVNGALAWFSQKLLKKYGRPVGWETDYNDGAYDRMSGFSANAEAIYLEIDQPASNHERVEAIPRLRGFLVEEGLLEAFNEVCDEVKVPRLPVSALQEVQS